MSKLTNVAAARNAGGISRAQIPGATAWKMLCESGREEDIEILAPLNVAEITGLLIRRIRSEDKITVPMPEIPWLVIIDATETRGVEFDKNTLSFLSQAADQITVTAVEPWGRFYAPFVKKALKEQHILLIRTRAEDVDVWQDAIRDILSAGTKAEMDTHWPTAPP